MSAGRLLGGVRPWGPFVSGSRLRRRARRKEVDMAGACDGWVEVIVTRTKEM